MIKYCRHLRQILQLSRLEQCTCTPYDTRSKNTKQYQTFKDIALVVWRCSVVDSGRQIRVLSRSSHATSANFEQWQKGALPVTQVHGDMHTNKRAARKMRWHESFFIAVPLSVSGNKSILRWALSLAGETDSHSGSPCIQQLCYASRILSRLRTQELCLREKREQSQHSLSSPGCR